MSVKNLASKTSDWPTDFKSDDTYGFTALPAGIKAGSYDHLGDGAFFWSTTTNGGSYAYYMILLYSQKGGYFTTNYKSFQNSVRCVADNATFQALLEVWD